MTLNHPNLKIIRTLFHSLYLILILVSGTLHASNVQTGLGSTSENSDAFRSYSGHLFFVVLGMILFLLVLRGLEIRRQHPRTID